jgi:sulfopyruvate decarboxylase subunit alpha
VTPEALPVSGVESQADLLDRRSQAVIAGVELIDPDFILHLASSTLKVVLDHFISGAGVRATRRVFAMPREEEGVAIAAGLELAGARPVLIFQDNGIGNLLTALLTLPQPYHLPLLGIVTRRGGLCEYNSMIHTISERSEALLDAAGVRWFQLDARTPLDRWATEIERAWTFARTTHRPVFVMVNLMGG